jgi:hypothetical protein
MNDRRRLDKRAGPIFRIAAVVEGFLDQPLHGEWWDARPLAMADPEMSDAVRAWAASHGGSVEEWTADETRIVDLMAVGARVQAIDSDRALAMAVRKLTPIVQALAYRQLRPGRIVVWIAHAEGGGSTHVQHPYLDPPKVYHEVVDETWTQEADVEAIAQAIQSSPTGPLFWGLFSDALADQTADGTLVRLWSILEALSRPFFILRRRQRQSYGWSNGQ